MSNDLIEAEDKVNKVVENIAETANRAEILTAMLNFPKHITPDALKAAAENYAEADQVSNELYRAWKHGEEQRIEFTSPLNEVIRKINAVFKSKLDPIDAMRTALKNAMGNYGRAELMWKREEDMKHQRAEQKRIDDIAIAKAHAAEQAGNHKEADRIIEQPMVAKTVPVSGATDAARSTTKVIWSARVTDKMAFIKAVASGAIGERFLIVDEAAIKKAAKEIGKEMKWPGVEFFEDVQIGNRR